MPPKYDREYWLGRAEEMRVLAAMMSNHRDAQNMLGVAESYLWLADNVAEQAEILAELSKHKAQQKVL
jgi:hypothetical protein